MAGIVPIDILTQFNLRPEFIEMNGRSHLKGGLESLTA